MHGTLDGVGSLALNRALRVDGCFVCGGTADLFTIRGTVEALCRTCVPKLGALLTCCRDRELGQWFVIDDSANAIRWCWRDADDGDDGDAGVSTDDFVSEALADLDPQVHADLAVEYEKSGLNREAIREAAIVLTLGYDREDATARSLGILFSSSRRKAGCFAGLAWAVRRTGR